VAGPGRGRPAPDAPVSEAGKGLRRAGLPAGRPALSAPPDPGPGEIAGQPGKTGDAVDETAAPGLAGVYGQGVDPVSEHFVAPGVEIYAAQGDSIGVSFFWFPS